MSSRKTHFEVVSLAEIAPLLAAQRMAMPAAAARPRRILLVTLNFTLATTREMLLASEGYTVTVALTSGDAVKQCESECFDLIVIGHSIPLEQRRLLLEEFRRRCSTPVLGLYRPGEAPLSDADYLFDATESPVLLLESVRDILRQTRTAN